MVLIWMLFAVQIHTPVPLHTTLPFKAPVAIETTTYRVPRWDWPTRSKKRKQGREIR
jgi:hypothetical protein